VVILGLSVALAVLAADQATKWAVLALLPDLYARPIEVTPYFNLVLVWNRGVSFGMFSGYSAYVPWLLTGVALIVVAFLFVWLRRASGPLPAAALGLIIGGALGNVIDRVRYGAVVDFLDFHYTGYHWPAFNLADTAICVGAALLLLTGLLAPRREAT
jgi:signal peptidase II